MTDRYKEDGVMVEFEEIGEGRAGDYNPNDPNDVELLRFYTHRLVTDDDPEYDLAIHADEDGECWIEVPNGSYCTQIPVTATPQQRLDMLMLIHARVRSLRKRDMEEASWFHLGMLV